MKILDRKLICCSQPKFFCFDSLLYLFILLYNFLMSLKSSKGTVYQMGVLKLSKRYSSESVLQLWNLGTEVDDQ